MSQLFVVVRHDNLSHRIVEVETAETVIGRRESCEIWLPDPLVSRKHALLTNSGGHWFVRDLGSRNGTLINGVAIRECAALSQGLELGIGRYRLAIFFDSSAAILNTLVAEESTWSGMCDQRINDPGLQIANLTPAQHRVCALLVEGLQEKEVAAALGISINTVHWHAKAIYRALDVSTRPELVSRWMNRRSVR
jgi:DNA-binding CsgD family transcriptional regulator